MDMLTMKRSTPLKGSKITNFHFRFSCLQNGRNLLRENDKSARVGSQRKQSFELQTTAESTIPTNFPGHFPASLNFQISYIFNVQFITAPFNTFLRCFTIFTLFKQNMCTCLHNFSSTISFSAMFFVHSTLNASNMIGSSLLHLKNSFISSGIVT